MSNVFTRPIYVLPLFRRLNNTPLRDLMRGRLTERLDYKALIANATDVPKPLRDAVLRVTKRTRLWRSEKVDVANELLAHFTDGIAAGDSVDDLVATFGDQRLAAKLIRRSRKRNRPLPWRAFARLRQGVGFAMLGVMVLYAGLTVRFFIGHPSPSVDYVARATADLAGIPESERGWPLYRQALLSLGGQTDAERTAREDLLYEHYDRREPQWTQIKTFLTDHAQAVADICRATDRRRIGFPYAAVGSQTDRVLWPESPVWEVKMADGVDKGTVPFLRETRTLLTILWADAKAAAEAHDAARWSRDVTAILKMARQLRDEPMSRFMGSVAWSIAGAEIDRALSEDVAMLPDDVLRDLAHRLAVPKVAADVTNYNGVREAFLDAVQHMYTDDGSADGRLTPAGIAYFQAEGKAYGRSAAEGEPPKSLLPATLVIGPSRKQLVAEFDAFLDGVEGDLHRPIREVEPKTAYARQVAWDALSGRPLSYLPGSPTSWIGNGDDWPNPVHVGGERALGARDGQLVGIALELFHRRHGHYPATLSELVPSLLPAIPPDRMTGGPVRYKLVDGNLLVYSVGADRDDDGGTVPLDHRSRTPNVYAAATWDTRTRPVDGDWVLFPMWVAERARNGG